MTRNINKKQLITMGLWVTLSAALQALALSSFSVPGHIYPSGILGLSRIVSDIFVDFLNVRFSYQYLYVGINMILAVIVYRHIGKLFTIFSLIQTILASVLASLFGRYIVVNDMILIAIFGGLINGAGVGLALMHGASSGGTDFLSVYYSNKYHKSMWNQVFLFNLVLITVTGFLYGWERAAYSIIYQYMNSYMIKRMHKRYTHQAIFIITKKPQQVIDSILNKVRHGITKVEAKGAFKGEDEMLLYTVVNSFETDEVVKLALEGDPHAFIETRDTADIYGNYYQKPLD